MRRRRKSRAEKSKRTLLLAHIEFFFKFIGEVTHKYRIRAVKNNYVKAALINSLSNSLFVLHNVL